MSRYGEGLKRTFGAFRYAVVGRAAKEILSNKIVVVPLSVYNDVLSEMRFGLSEVCRYDTVYRKADSVAKLAKALCSASYYRYVDGKGLAFASGLAYGGSSYASKVNFAFVLDAVNFRNTVDYCVREIELITKQVYEREGINPKSIEKWLEVKVVESIREVSKGKFLCDMY